MANEATLGILMTLNDQATPKLAGFKTTLSENKTAIRELAMGVSYLGMSFVSMGIMLKSSNTEFGKSIGSTLLMVGAITTAISSTVQFISAISKVISALRALAAAEILVKAFQGPAGWAMILGGIAVAGGAIAGISAMEKGEKRAGTVNITNNIQGSVITEKQLSDTLRREVIKSQQRNNTSGIK